MSDEPKPRYLTTRWPAPPDTIWEQRAADTIVGLPAKVGDRVLGRVIAASPAERGRALDLTFEVAPGTPEWELLGDVQGLSFESYLTWSPWRDLEVCPGWHVPAGFPPPQYRRRRDGRIELRGTCSPQEGTDRRSSPIRLPKDALPDLYWAAKNGWTISEDGAVSFADDATGLLTILP